MSCGKELEAPKQDEDDDVDEVANPMVRLTEAKEVIELEGKTLIRLGVHWASSRWAANCGRLRRSIWCSRAAT